MAILIGFGLRASMANGQLETEEEPATINATALHWVRLSGAYDCIAGDALSRSVETKLRRPIFSMESSFPLLIEGHVERREDGYRADLRMTARDGTLLGTRTLNSAAADCHELSETISVVLAVMIDPEASIQTTPPIAAPAAPPAPVSVPAAAEEPAQTLLAFTRAGVNLNPGLALGFGAAYERGLPSFGGIRAEGVGFLEAHADLDAPLSGVYLRLAYGGLGYCPLWFDTRAVRMSGCVGAELGVRQSEGFGFKQNQGKSSVDLWASASARASLAFRVVSTVMVIAGVGFFAPINTPNYVARASANFNTPVYRQPAAGALFDLGIGARF